MEELKPIGWVTSNDLELGKRITAVRNQRGVSMETLANHLGVSKQSVGKWELGQRAIKHHDLANLCTALGVSADHLLFDQRVWPFKGVDAEKIGQLEEPDILQLQGGILTVAGQVGLDIATARPPAPTQETKVAMKEAPSSSTFHHPKVRRA